MPQIKPRDMVTMKSGGIPFRVKKIVGDKVLVEWKIKRSRESKGYKEKFQIVRYWLTKSNLKKVS